MPEVTITIGGRSFDVACQEGEQPFLQHAAELLDNEASVLVDQAGRLPEQRMLLMAGLMLADKYTGLAEKAAGLEDQIATLEADRAAAAEAPPQRVEVPTVPQDTADSIAELAARAEALADAMETP